MIMDDNDGQLIFRDLGSLKLPDICLTGEEKPRKNLTQETCPDRGSNPGPLRDRCAIIINIIIIIIINIIIIIIINECVFLLG